MASNDTQSTSMGAKLGVAAAVLAFFLAGIAASRAWLEHIEDWLPPEKIENRYLPRQEVAQNYLALDIVKAEYVQKHNCALIDAQPRTEKVRSAWIFEDAPTWSLHEAPEGEEPASPGPPSDRPNGDKLLWIAPQECQAYKESWLCYLRAQSKLRGVLEIDNRTLIYDSSGESRRIAEVRALGQTTSFDGVEAVTLDLLSGVEAQLVLRFPKGAEDHQAPQALQLGGGFEGQGFVFEVRGMKEKPKI